MEYGISDLVVADLGIQINKISDCSQKENRLKHTTEQFEPFCQYVLTPAIRHKLRDRDDNP